MDHQRILQRRARVRSDADDRDGRPGRTAATAHLQRRARGAPLPSGIVQRDGGGAIAADAEAAVSAATGGSGAPMPPELRERFEGSLGADLSAVRVHTGDASADASDAIGARAYTLGQNIHFAGGQYDPHSADGQHLLAHEVAHTVQQAGGTASARQAKMEVSQPGDALEVEADVAAAAMIVGEPAAVTTGHGIARKPETKPAESVDKEHMRKLASGTAGYIDQLAASQGLAGAMGTQFHGSIERAMDAYKTLDATFQAARKKVQANVEAQVQADEAAAAAIRSALDGLIKYGVGKAITAALGPYAIALNELIAFGKHGKDLVDALKDSVGGFLTESIGSGITYALAGPAPAPKTTTVTVPPGVTVHENWKKLADLEGEVVGHLGSLLTIGSKFGPGLSNLRSHLEAHMNSGTSSDGTLKPAADLETAYGKLAPIKGLCARIDAESQSFAMRAKLAESTAVGLGQTDAQSAERQVWTMYRDQNPDQQLSDPDDAFGKEDRPHLNKNKMHYVRQIGKQAQVSAPVNKFAGNPLLPGAGLMVTPAAGSLILVDGSVGFNGKAFRAVTREPTAVLPPGAPCTIVDARVGSIDQGMDENNWALVVEPLGVTATKPEYSSEETESG